jgi:hypothetical protein
MTRFKITCCSWTRLGQDGREPVHQLCAQHERQRCRSYRNDDPDWPVAIFFPQISLQDLFVPRAGGADEIQVLRINGDILVAIGVYDRTEGGGDGRSKSEARVVLVEEQHRARQ